MVAAKYKKDVKSIKNDENYSPEQKEQALKFLKKEYKLKTEKLDNDLAFFSNATAYIGVLNSTMHLIDTFFLESNQIYSINRYTLSEKTYPVMSFVLKLYDWPAIGISVPESLDENGFNKNFQRVQATASDSFSGDGITMTSIKDAEDEDGESAEGFLPTDAQDKIGDRSIGSIMKEIKFALAFNKSVIFFTEKQYEHVRKAAFMVAKVLRNTDISMEQWLRDVHMRLYTANSTLENLSIQQEQEMAKPMKLESLDRREFLADKIDFYNMIKDAYSKVINVADVARTYLTKEGFIS